jgi:O-antigen ligase
LATAALTNARANQNGRLKNAGMAFFWLSAFYFVYCARPEDWYGGLAFLPLAKITGIAGLLAFLFASSKGRRKLRDLPVEFYLLSAIILILVISSLLSPIWKMGALSFTMDFAKVLIVWMLTFLLVTDLPRFRRIVFLQAASVPMVSVISIVKGHSLPRLEGVLGGSYANSNDLAFAIALSVPLCLVFLLTARTGFRKLLWAAGILAMLAALFMTASRGGLITLIFTGGVCLWHFGVRGKRFYLIIIGGVAAIVLLMVAGKTMQDRFASMWSDRSDLRTREQYRAQDSFEQRQFLIDRAIECMQEYPILGVGARNFETYSTTWLEVHMAYLQIGAEGGIPCLILYLLFFFYGFRNIRKLMKRRDLDPELKLFAGALQGVLVGFGVGALFAPEAYQFFPFFAVAYTSVLLAYVRELDRANATAKPATQLGRTISPNYANAGVPVNT